MAKIDSPWDAERIYGLKGTLDFYEWKGLHVVRSWPQMPPSSLTAATRAQNPVFGYIQQQWQPASLEVKLALTEMSTETQRLPRDYQLELYYGYGIEIRGA